MKHASSGLPDSYPSSTIGSEGLNCLVRNGNGCFPLDIVTGKTCDNRVTFEAFPEITVRLRKSRERLSVLVSAWHSVLL